MTDRFHSLTVVLDKDIREDDAEGLIDAIKHMRGVLSVEGIVSNYEAHMAVERARRELGTEILSVIFPDTWGKRKKEG